MNSPGLTFGGVVETIYFNDREGQTILTPAEQEGLLLNHVSNFHQLDKAEQANIEEGIKWLQSYEGHMITDTVFRTLHKRLFGHVWRWAGEYRIVEKNIGVEYWRVPSEVHKLIEDLNFWVENNSYPWYEMLAHFHHRLVYIHPFSNGNGRFSRILTNELCMRYEKKAPSWRADLSEKVRRSLYIEALRDADLKRFEKLIEFMSHTEEQLD